VLDIKILKLMFKEEFRLHASFFNRSYLPFSSLAIIIFTFIMGATLPMLRRVVTIDEILLVAHWILLFYGLGVGGFAMFADRILERRFGSVSLLLTSSYTLPIRFIRLFFLFYIKDTLYYIFFTILPMIMGLALASLFVPISFSSLLFLFVSLTLSFLLGISFSVLMFAALVRLGAIGLVIAAAGGFYLWFSGIDVKLVAAQLPSLVFYHSHSFYIVPGVLITSLVLGVISSRFIKKVPSPHERRAKEAFMKIVRLTSRFSSKYSPMLSKDIVDLVRSGIIFPVILTFLTPLLFLYAVTCFVAVPYLVVVGYLKGEMDLLLISLFIMLTVSDYVGSVLAYLTGLFTNSYLLDANILLQFTLAVVPVLLAETLLSFYYQFNSEFATLYIAGMGPILVAASIVFLSKLDNRWKGKMFRIA
jgi:hypothetical protein